VSRYKGLPSRNLAIAIREYAPGAEIVLDGRVFQSAGVSLHWHNLNADSNEAQKMDLAWRCGVCGELGYEDSLIGTDELLCTNNECNAPITLSNTRRVLQPAGFVTDAYQPASNNINHQKFIPVEPAWVFVKADKTPLPNPALGMMAYGPEGQVFHHSSGEQGAGFALCMTCGRADSMLAKGEFPVGLSPSGQHYPPRPGKEDKDQNNKRLPCQGSGSIMGNISLGAKSFTDVFELTLRHPVSGEYIADNGQGIAIAMTLAVALRLALAEILGVSASELGYATRPSKLQNGQAIRIIQLYDVISGGAGFASSAPLHVERLLKLMVRKLNCKHCETGCSECLLDSQTRHDHDTLDRQRALEWLGNGFEHYVGLADADKLSLEDGQYEPGSLENVLRRLINEGATRLTLFASGEAGDWDLDAPQFRRALQNYILTDGVMVDLVVPAGLTDEDVLHDLASLQLLGVNVGYHTTAHIDCVAGQVLKGGVLHTLATRSRVATLPGTGWHQSDELVVLSKIAPAVMWEPMSLTHAPNVGAKDLQIHDELNGPLLRFGERFWDLVSEQNSQIAELLEAERITKLIYSDRYIQNPAVVTILGSLLMHVKDRLTDDATAQVRTLFKAGRSQGQKAFDDWVDQDDFEFFASKWLSAMVGKNVDFCVEASNRDIPHHRKLLLEFESGRCLKVRFDQGVAYWRVRFGSHRDMWFDFDRPVEDQVMQMAAVIDTAQVQNSEQKWATDVLVELQR